MNYDFPKGLKKCRLKKGVSRYRMAIETGLGQDTLYHYEHGMKEPRLSSLIKIADCLGVTLDELAGRTVNNT